MAAARVAVGVLVRAPRIYRAVTSANRLANLSQIGSEIVAEIGTDWRALDADSTVPVDQQARAFIDLLIGTNLYRDDEEILGPFDQDGVGKVKGDLPVPGELSEDDLLDGERQLQESIEQREREQNRNSRGSPNGNRDDRENNRRWRDHQRRLEEERRVLREIQDRIDG